MCALEHLCSVFSPLSASKQEVFQYVDARLAMLVSVEG
jgi:hypothetical protein